MSDQHDGRFFREVAIRYVGARRRCPDAIREPANVAAYLRSRIRDDAREHFVAIYLDGRHRPIADSIGTATASLVHPREVFQPAIALGACALLIGHNHPSGDPTPSREDLDVTKRLADAGRILRITVLDHVVWHEGTGSTRSDLPPPDRSNPSIRIGGVAADIDGDGDADVLAAFGDDHTIAWFENTDGLGTFGLAQTISTHTAYANSVTAAHLSGDGALDVAAAYSTENRVAWFPNADGAGSFGERRTVTTDQGSASWVSAADIDGDGDPDLLASSVVGGQISWYQNVDGFGTFGAAQAVSTAANGELHVIAADLDADGDLDVVAPSLFDSRIAWYENTDGLGTFGAQQTIWMSASGANSVFAADIDGDGDLDVLSASGTDDKIAWYERRNPSEPLAIDTDGDGLVDGASGIVTTGTYPGGLDNDGDGFVDGEQEFGTDPKIADTDGDGFADAVEVASNTDPNHPNSFPVLAAVPVLRPGTAIVLLSLLMILGARAGRRRANGAAGRLE